MARSGGISGVAVAGIAAGALLLVSGVRNAPLIDALREVLAGGTPTGKAPVITPVVGAGGGAGAGAGAGVVPTPGGGGGMAQGGLGARIAHAARGWIGTRYVWGGTSRAGVDCSGLVYRCLNEAGVTVSRKTALGYRMWNGAQDIPRSQCAAGDLVCYTGHIGIATSGTMMIQASGVHRPTNESKIYNGQGGPIIRRVRG